MTYLQWWIVSKLTFRMVCITFIFEFDTESFVSKMLPINWPESVSITWSSLNFTLIWFISTALFCLNVGTDTQILDFSSFQKISRFWVSIPRSSTRNMFEMFLNRSGHAFSFSSHRKLLDKRNNHLHVIPNNWIFLPNRSIGLLLVHQLTFKILSKILWKKVKGENFLKTKCELRGKISKKISWFSGNPSPSTHWKWKLISLFHGSPAACHVGTNFS